MRGLAEREASETSHERRKMMVYRNATSYDNTVSFIGNGRMIVCCEGPAIKSVCGGYSSPCILSLSIDRPYESESGRIDGIGAYYHELYFTDQSVDGVSGGIPDARITDYMDSERRVFIRHCEVRETFFIKFISPNYVRKNHYASYSFGETRTGATLFTVPAGSRYYESLFSASETRMLVFVLGDASLTESGITVGPGSADAVFVCGSGEECIENACYAAKNVAARPADSKIYKGFSERYAAILSATDDDCAKAALFSLAVRQAESGGIMASDQLPLADICAFPPALEVFDRLGLNENADRLIGYYVSLYSRTDRISTYSSLEDKTVIPDASCVKAAAILLKGLMYRYRDRKPAGDVLAVMKKAFYAAVSSFENGFVRFSGCEDEFTCGIIPPEYIDQASADATCEAISACVGFLDYAKRFGIRLRNDGSAHFKPLSTAAGQFYDRFAADGVISASSSRIYSLSKSKRFIYARCAGCIGKGRIAPVVQLERDRRGVYLCPDCFGSRDREDIDRSELIPSVYATAKALLYRLIPEDKICLTVKALREFAASYSGDVTSVPVRASMTDIMLIRALKSVGDETAELERILDEITDSESALSSMISGDRRIGRQADSCATAHYLLLLLISRGKGDGR